MEAYLTKEVCNRNIKRINKVGKELDTLIHETAVSSLYHAENDGNGDFSLCGALVEAMPRSARKKALIYWFTQFGPLVYNEKEKKFTKDKKPTAKPYNVAGAEANPFYDYTPEKNVAPVTLEAVIKAMASKLVHGVERGEVSVEEIRSHFIGKVSTKVDEILASLKPQTDHMGQELKA
jgi:hypothetical protein